jgi:hypothetical protein
MKASLRRLLAAAIPIALAATVAGVSPAAEQERPAAVIDARTDQILRQMSDYLAKSPHFTFEADMAMDEVLPSGQKLQHQAATSIALSRPDGLYVEQSGPLGSRIFWYDGKRVTLFDPQTGFYAEAPAPATVGAMLAGLFAQLGFVPPLSDLLVDDPYNTVQDKVDIGIYVGRSEIDGVPVQHLAFVQETVDWQIWVEDGAAWVPRKFLINYKIRPGEPQYSATLKNWDFATPISPALFRAELPPDATRIEFEQRPAQLKKGG